MGLEDRVALVVGELSDVASLGVPGSINFYPRGLYVSILWEMKGLKDRFSLENDMDRLVWQHLRQASGPF
jgi:hypothetical protein